MDLSALLDLAEKALKVLAFGVAGTWAYVKYVRGRTFRRRLEVSLKLQLRESAVQDYVLVTISVKNVGLSKVPIDGEGTALRLSTSADGLQATSAEHVSWTSVGTLPILTDHEWIEPGEPIEDIEILILPKVSCKLVKAELFIVSGETEWTARAVEFLAKEAQK